MNEPQRVVVLGGGIAGLAAAWELSRPEHRDAVRSVTVYQRGWRLGGKGASSRGVHGRIEEHGLHVWLGYYENAFRLVRECYAELDRPRTDPTCPILRWDDAFRPASLIGLGEQRGGEWSHWTARFHENDGLPGEPGADRTPLTPSELLGRALRLIGDFAASLRPHEGSATSRALVITGDPVPPTPKGAGARGPVVVDAAFAGALELVETVRGALPGSAGPADTVVAPLVDAIDTLVAHVRSALQARLERDDAARRTWQFVDLVRAIARGIVVDGLLDRPEGYAAVDDVDYREWLERHGARADTLRSPLVRVVYDLVFGYEDGDPERPRFAAGTGLLLSGKMFFDYQGAIFWKMTAGMGDVVFAPLHDALRARGVRFRFFHRVDRLRAEAGAHRVEAVDLGLQARLARGIDEYEPLVDVGGLRCWPDLARADLLDPEAGTPGDDLECLWSAAPDTGSLELRDGVDYDALVLAIPVGMHRYVCADLIANPRTPEWRSMTDHLGTVATRAMQLWLRADEPALGWNAPDITVSGYPGAFHTYASMTSLLDAEHWPAADAPKSLAYFCHVHPAGAPPPGADHGYPSRERERVAAAAVEYLETDVAHLWPQAHRVDGFRWELLHGPDGASREERLGGQYLRVNVDPSDRYVLSLPGTSTYRLRADASGYANLVLAGDWTDNGLNAGCIEAAVVSGLQAANAVLGRGLLDGVAGFYPTHRAMEARVAAPAAVARAVTPPAVP